MRVVLDTNVLVSALWTVGGVPSRVAIQAVRDGRITPLYDERIFAEYREVLSRPRFPFTPDAVETMLRQFREAAVHVIGIPSGLVLPDADDLPFVEVALAGAAEAIVTGNARHFPPECGVRVLSPRELLDLLEARGN